MRKVMIEIFKTDKDTDIQVVFENDTIWLNQEQMAKFLELSDLLLPNT